MKSQFSTREQDVISLLLEGKANKEIAFSLGIANRTVETHLSSIYNKLNVTSRTMAVIKLSEDASWKTAGILETNNQGNPQLQTSDDEAILSMNAVSHPLRSWWRTMIYIFFSLVPLAIGGVALYLKSQKSWLKTTGFILFGFSLFGLLFIPIFGGLPIDEFARKELGYKPYLYFSFAPLTIGGFALYLKGSKPWLKTIGFILFGIAFFGLCFFPVLLWQLQ